MTARKILFLVIDGLSDRPCPELGNLTPLEAAHRPNLNRLAAEGVCGIMDTIATGIRPGQIPHTSPCWVTIPTRITPAGARSNVKDQASTWSRA